jgi:hypothetical protein
MVRPTRRSRTIQQLRHELGALLKLCPWVLVAVLLVAVFWQADLAATSGLFQSPPTAEPPTPIPSDTPVALPTLAPTEPVTVEVTVEPEATVEVTPTATLEATPTVEATPTETPSPEPEAEEPEATATWTPEPEGEEGTTRGRYAEGEPALQFDWAMLLDSVALGVSYIWLCCGVVVLVGIPIAFGIVWAASRRRRSPSE